MQNKIEDRIIELCKINSQLHRQNKNVPIYPPIVEQINKEFGILYNSEDIRRISRKFREKNGLNEWFESSVPVVETKEDKLFKERVKYQDRLREYNSGLREDARFEMLCETISDAISNLKPLNIPKIKIVPKQKDIAPLLLLADQHYDVEFKIMGLEQGEVLNEYNPEIFEKRMWKLLEETVVLCERNNQNQLNLFSLGDSTEGIIAIRQLMSLRYGLVDSCIKYADFMAAWLNKITEYIKVDYYSTFGNHTMLRLLDNKKETFKNENMQKIIDYIIELKTLDNPNITIHKNNCEKIYANILGLDIIGIHGEEKSAEQALKDFSSMYGKDLSLLCYGHKHHSYFESVGFGKFVVGAGSIMGTEDFAVALKSVSNPCSNFCLLERKYGLVQENIINL